MGIILADALVWLSHEAGGGGGETGEVGAFSAEVTGGITAFTPERVVSGLG